MRFIPVTGHVSRSGLRHVCIDTQQSSQSVSDIWYARSPSASSPLHLCHLYPRLRVCGSMSTHVTVRVCDVLSGHANSKTCRLRNSVSLQRHDARAAWWSTAVKNHARTGRVQSSALCTTSGISVVCSMYNMLRLDNKSFFTFLVDRHKYGK